MFCIRCGRQNVPGANFCYNCGTPMIGEKVSGDNPVPPGPTVPLEGEAFPPGGGGQTENPSPESPELKQNIPPSQPYLPGQPLGWNGPPTGSLPPPSSYNPGTGPFPYKFSPGAVKPKIQVAPNGIPYPVLDNPAAFYTYSNQAGKKVYAALAPFGPRIGAALIDTILVSLFNTFLIFFYLLFFSSLDPQTLSNPDSLETNFLSIPWVAWIIGGIYLLYCTLMLWLFKGRTLGKMITRIKVIRLNGASPDFPNALLRSVFGFSQTLGSIIAPFGALFYVISFGLNLMVIIGFVRAFTDKRRQGWHDKLAETIVVRAEEMVQGINF